MLKDAQEGGGGFSSAAELRGGASNDLGTKMKMVALKVVTYVMGVFFLKNFFLIFLIIIPIFLVFFTLMFAQFYDSKIIINNDEDHITNIATTNHNFLIMVITTLVVFGTLSLVIDYSTHVIGEITSDKGNITEAKADAE